MESSDCSGASVDVEPDGTTPDTSGNSEIPSQLFRIEIENHSGLLLGYTQVKKILTKKLKLKLHKIKVSGKITPLVFIMFTCEEDQEEALNAINNFVLKDQKLTAKKLDPIANTSPPKANSVAKVNSEGDTLEQEDPLRANPSAVKRKADESNNPEVKKAKTTNHTERFTSALVRQATTPLWSMQYDLQLIKKEKDATKLLTKLTTELMKANPLLKEKYSQQSEEEDNLCCPLLPMIGSPETSAYCNKCEFQVGLHPESARPTVGFEFNSKNFGGRCVADAWHCNNIPPNMVKAAELFQAYLRVSSLAVFDATTYEGFWRQLTVRTNRKGQLLLVVVLHPQNLSEEEMEDKKMKLKSFFSGCDLDVTSLSFQKSVMIDKSNSLLQNVFGSTFIEEELLGMNLRISADAYFPANTLGAELLLTSVKEFASVTKQTTVLNLCCGMGSIAISLARDVSKVIGVDMNQTAIENAWHNARTHGIQNVEFVCGKVEDVIFRVVNKLAKEEDVIAILEPPKTGLTNKVSRALRTVPGLKRLVYVSGSPQQAMPSYLDLCRQVSTNYRGTAFQPVKAQAIDLLPQTNNWELVLLFERE